MSRVFLDVNVPMYAGGVEHPLRAPSQRIIMAVASDQLDAVTDAEVFQELLYRYLHINQRCCSKAESRKRKALVASPHQSWTIE